MEEEGSLPLLVDVYHRDHATHFVCMAVSLREWQTVFLLATHVMGAELNDLSNSIFQLEWSSPDGSIILHDHDRLPSGFSDEEECAWLQLGHHMSRSGSSQPCDQSAYGYSLVVQDFAMNVDGCAPDEAFDYIFVDSRHQMCEVWYSGFQSFSLLPNNRAAALFSSSRSFSSPGGGSQRFGCWISVAIMDLFFVTAHALHSGVALVDRAAWWESFRSQVAIAAKGAELVVLLDANARIGAIEYDSFGGYTQDEEDSNGDFAHRFQLHAPATFQDKHYGKLHPNGRSFTRIDYVLLPQTWQNRCSWSWVEDSLHVGHAKLKCCSYFSLGHEC